MSLTVKPVEQLTSVVKEYRKAEHSVSPLFFESLVSSCIF